MQTAELFRAVKNMKRFGGSFAACIAEAMERADAENASRLLAAFPEMFRKYADPVWGE